MDSAQGSGGNFELRFDDLHVRGRGFAFPCDAQGHVDLDALSEQARENYLYARALIGRATTVPVVRVVGESRTGASQLPPSSCGIFTSSV